MHAAKRTVSHLGCLFVVLAACTTNTTNNNGTSSGGSGSAPAATADCKSRCEKKGTACGATAANAALACASVCDGRYTTDQLNCLEATDCAKLQTKAGFDAACPAPNGSTSGGTSGGTSSGTTGGTTHFSCRLNGTCYKCADADGVEKCAITTGPGPGCTETSSSYCDP